MSESNGDGIKIVISFILILVLGVSMFAVFKTGDKLLSNLDGYLGIEGTTSVVTDGSGNPSGSQQTTVKPQETTVAKTYATTYNSVGGVEFLPVGYFHKTIDGVTYFYAAYEWAPASSWADYEGPACVKYRVNDYGTYSAVLMLSYDLQFFNLPENMSGSISDNDNGWKEYAFKDLEAKGGKLYVSYCSITNCNNPDEVMSDLQSNVFNDLSYFAITVGPASDEPGELPS